jgi:hypothetical protein
MKSWLFKIRKIRKIIVFNLFFLEQKNQVGVVGKLVLYG